MRHSSSRNDIRISLGIFNEDRAAIIRERIFGIPVDPEILFAATGNIYHPRIEKRQRQLIIKLSFVRSFLHPGEKVIQVTTAYSPLRLSEQLLTAGLFLGVCERQASRPDRESPPAGVSESL